MPRMPTEGGDSASWGFRGGARTETARISGEPLLGPAMDAGAAASFYRRKGYTVREGVRATGASGNEHRVPLLAEGPLGSLAVFFGDLGGIDGPEMGGARKVARDLGATPVLAADTFSNEDRQTAARLGVVLLDGDAVAVEPAAPAPSADPARSWPGLAPIPA